MEVQRRTKKLASVIITIHVENYDPILGITTVTGRIMVENQCKRHKSQFGFLVVKKLRKCMF
jgi:hypothetical protein